jgi:ABC-type lipoprotein release transport system permease subunit
MMLKIAFRNIFRQKRRTILTMLTMLGGFVLSAFSVGMSDGTYNRIIDMFTRNRLGHIQIHREGYLDKPAIYKTVDNYRQVGKKVGEVDGVLAWAPRLYSSGLVSVNDKSTGARVIGVNPIQENEATNFDKKIIEGRTFSDTAAHEAILGKGLANILDAGLKDTIVIVSQGADGSIANDLYEIVGLLESGDDMSDQTAFYLHIDDAQELLVLEGRVHELIIIAGNMERVERLTIAIRKALDDPGLAVASWKEFAKSFYRAMKVDQEGNWILLMIIIGIAAVGVLNTVLMTVLERRREYGVLKAIGMRPGQIFRLVIEEVGIMSIFSIIIGFVIGLIANYIFSQTGIPTAMTFTYGGIEFSRMYTEINARSFYMPGLAVFLSALIVSIFPALRAAHVPPARAMRMH